MADVYSYIITAIGNSNVAFNVTESCPAQDNQHSVEDETELSKAELSKKSTALNNVTAKCTDSFPCHVISEFYTVNAKYEERKCGSCHTVTMAQNMIMCDKCLVWFHW